MLSQKTIKTRCCRTPGRSRRAPRLPPELAPLSLSLPNMRRRAHLEIRKCRRAIPAPRTWSVCWNRCFQWSLGYRFVRIWPPSRLTRGLEQSALSSGTKLFLRLHFGRNTANARANYTFHSKYPPATFWSRSNITTIIPTGCTTTESPVFPRIFSQWSQPS